MTAAPEYQGCFTTTTSTLLWLHFVLLLVVGCQSTPSPATGANQFETGSGEIRSEQTLWSPTLHWAGARFRFELHADEENHKPQIERRQETDILRVGDLEVELVRTRF
ncbi:MAG TPA: hypothetical protein EYO84_00305, partial [Planctomycetes bacterium]|nr:hypothetical protein [Planctomycetota bacterium]